MWASVISTIDFEGTVLFNQLSQGSPLLAKTAFFCAHYLIFVLFIIPLTVIVLDRDTNKRFFGWRVVAQSLLAIIVATAIGYVLGALVGRPRPFISYPNDIIPYGFLPASSSFPSAHAWIASAFATTFLFHLHFRKMGWWLVVIAVLVALSRVVVGMHYLSDVSVGLILGVVSAYMVTQYGPVVLSWLIARRGKLSADRY